MHGRRAVKMVVLDMDSSVSPTYGDQEGSAYNGHFGCTCYHPLFVFNQFGDLERCSLRSGKLVKIGAKVIRHARATTFQMAEVAVPRDLFRSILERINALRPTQGARC